MFWPTVLAAGWTHLGSRLRRTWTMIKRTVLIHVDVFSYKKLTLDIFVIGSNEDHWKAKSDGIYG